MGGSVALVGGDEFRPGCEEMDNAILRASGEDRPSLLVVPTAAAHQNPSKAASNGVSYFESLGADANPLMVLDEPGANDPRLLSPLDAADVVYLTGGDPSHLLDALSGSLLLRKLLEALDRGAVLAGSSAGAMVLGQWMRYRGWQQALGVVQGVATLPHHERSDSRRVAEELESSLPSGIAALGIDGRTGCLGGPSGWRTLGPGHVTVYSAGGWRRYSEGQTFQLED